MAQQDEKALNREEKLKALEAAIVIGEGLR